VISATLPLGQIVKGDALAVLRTFPSGSVQCVVTSPPYWGLRDYSEIGQYGLEATPEAHVAVMVEVFREVRRVLRDDGVCWVNYGDCYAAGGLGAGGDKQQTNWGSGHGDHADKPRKAPPGLKPKDLVGMPWRVAFALQADGWWLRADCIWAKPNPMPESVTDRPTKSHEYVFLLTKRAKYFYDAEAVREDKAPATVGDPRTNGHGHRRDRDYPGAPSNDGTNLGGPEGGRNLRTVWEIATQPYPGAHFATFPEALVERCIRAGTSEKGACPACGAPWVRVVEKHLVPTVKAGQRFVYDGRDGNGHEAGDQGSNRARDGHKAGFIRADETTGWRPSCECMAPGFAVMAPTPIPCVVLDPFAGSGTVGLVAYREGREFVGIDLAGGDKDLGGHTAHDRLKAGKLGRNWKEHAAHQASGQGELLGEGC